MNFNEETVSLIEYREKKAYAIEHLRVPFIEIVAVTDVHLNIDICVYGNIFLASS